jgi:hypothetical protein
MQYPLPPNGLLAYAFNEVTLELRCNAIETGNGAFEPATWCAPHGKGCMRTRTVRHRTSKRQAEQTLRSNLPSMRQEHVCTHLTPAQYSHPYLRPAPIATKLRHRAMATAATMDRPSLSLAEACHPATLAADLAPSHLEGATPSRLTTIPSHDVRLAAEAVRRLERAHALRAALLRQCA